MQPPEGLQRLPGPRTILYYLHRDPDLRREGARLPRSPRTIWRLLHQTGLLVEQEAHEHHLLPRPGPLQEVQVDFKDASTVRPDPSEPGSKQQHVVEICNAVDAGTSIWLDAQVHADFHAETALQAVINFLFTYGCPPMMTFDHDPRWVGSRSGRDFPSALCRFLRCVGVEPHLCPPHQPKKNAFVERLHRSLKEECLLVHHPGTLQEVRTVTAQYQHHYNQKRPHQGFSCRNQPPRVAFPTLPTLPPLPDPVDPDAWLQALHGHALARKIGSDGCVTVDGETYSISRALCGQQVTLLLNAPSGPWTSGWETRRSSSCRSKA
ncbi:hypothetical protein KSC_101730 [Ktedonobacter sp. SOSP1-52]|uniref:integrase core domain-containing protein n=1 Tax=Ktedonobacter sp. SOSP1-52 TaxID=2778366 RepID=UPI001A1E9CF3|nr:integrase core domain-containing protein [Ktedonobacter sp. SOSP1-52]GHO71281.1 hypothetical protein KSC_101730 [Ktedonobacter sp. SOSP1-52]